MDKYYIYKLFCDDSCYVGSTKNIHKRLLLHKSNSKTMNTKCYIMMRELGGFENFKCEILDEIVASTSTAKKLENFYIKQLKPDLNTNNSFSTPEEKREYLRDYKKRQLLVNPDYKRNLNRLDYAKNKHYYNRREPCECGAFISPLNKSNHCKTKKHKKIIEQINQNI